VLSIAAHAEAMRGNFDLARDNLGQARERFEELSLRTEAAAMVLESSRVEMLAGDPAAAELELRRGDAVLSEIGERFVRSTLAGLLAQALCAQARLVEAEEATILAEELSDFDDIDAQVIWRCTRAKVLAAQGRLDDAEGLVSSAVELIEPTDAVVMQISAFVDAGVVLSMCGRAEGAELLERALELARAKGSEILEARVLAVVAQAAHA
jgi:ATP/maltotriose-dependent transcriptional regulator MalT